MGGKFGEMSTLMNHTFQSFNFRGRHPPYGCILSRSHRQRQGPIRLQLSTCYAENMLKEWQNVNN
jgi:Mn-containing catalase